MKKVFLSALSFIKRRFGMANESLLICVNCGLPRNNDHIHCSRLEICKPEPSPMCFHCAEESDYTCYKCELEISGGLK